MAATSDGRVELKDPGQLSSSPRGNRVDVGLFSLREVFLLLLLCTCIFELINRVFDMRYFSLSSLVAGLSVLGSTFGQRCRTRTIQDGIPTDNEVALHTYSYCGGNLNVTVRVT
jgi:hypothetical protein